MMPNVAGDESTRRQILAYALLLAPIGALPWLLGYAGAFYGAAAVILGAEFVRRAFLLWRHGDADNQTPPSACSRIRSSISSRSSRRVLAESLAAGWTGG